MDKNKLQTLLGLIVSLICLYYAFNGIKFKELYDSIFQLNIGLLLALYPLLAINYIIFSLRWQFILKPLKNISFKTVFSIMMIGYVCNNLLPARIGELVRVYFLGKKESLKKSSILASILIERLADVYALLLFLILALLYSPFNTNWAHMIGYTITGGLTFITLILFSMMKWQERYLTLIRFLFKNNSEHIESIFISFTQPLHQLKNIKFLLMLICYSILAWCINALLTFCFFKLFSFDIPIYGTLFVLAVTQLGTIVPSSPGYIGTTQVLWQISLGVFAISKVNALSASLIFHGFWYIPITIIGLYFLAKEGSSIYQLNQEVNKSD